MCRVLSNCKGKGKNKTKEEKNNSDISEWSDLKMATTTCDCQFLFSVWTRYMKGLSLKAPLSLLPRSLIYFNGNHFSKAPCRVLKHRVKGHPATPRIINLQFVLSWPLEIFLGVWGQRKQSSALKRLGSYQLINLSGIIW